MLCIWAQLDKHFSNFIKPFKTQVFALWHCKKTCLHVAIGFSSNSPEFSSRKYRTGATCEMEKFALPLCCGVNWNQAQDNWIPPKNLQNSALINQCCSWQLFGFFRVLTLLITPSQTTSESINKYLPLTDILSGAPKCSTNTYTNVYPWFLKHLTNKGTNQLNFSCQPQHGPVEEYSEHKNNILFYTPCSPSGSIIWYHILDHVGLSGNHSNNKIIREELYLTWILYLYPKILLSCVLSFAPNSKVHQYIKFRYMGCTSQVTVHMCHMGCDRVWVWCMGVITVRPELCLAC